MIFCIILISICIIIYICCKLLMSKKGIKLLKKLKFIKKDYDEYLVEDSLDTIKMCSFITLIILILVVILFYGCARVEENCLKEMRANPYYYSQYDASKQNLCMISHRKFQGTIFSFYNGIDLTPLELENYFPINVVEDKK